MSNQKSKIIKVKALLGQTLFNGTGQSLVVNKDAIGTFQVVGSVPNTSGMGGPNMHNNLVVNITFGGQTMQIQSKGSNPNISWDDNLRQMITYHENGKPAQFEILPNDVSPSQQGNSRADGTLFQNAESFFNKTLLTVASVSGSVGILVGLYVASKKPNPTVWTYVGHGFLGLVIGGTAGGIVTKVFGVDQPSEPAAQTK